MQSLTKFLVSSCLFLGLVACANSDDQGANGTTSVTPATSNLSTSGSSLGKATGIDPLQFGVADADRVTTSLSSERLDVLVNVNGLGEKFSRLDDATKAALMQYWIEEELSPIVARGEFDLLERVELGVVSVQNMNEYGNSDEPFELITLVRFTPRQGELVVSSVEADTPELREVMRSMIISTNLESHTSPLTNYEQRLNIPEAYYLLEGRPQIFSFDSLILVEDVDSLFYVADGSLLPFKFSLKSRYVKFFPEAGHAGTYDFGINVYNSQGKFIDRIQTKIIVSPEECAVPTNVNALVVGHSVSTSWPLHWANKLRDLNSINLDMLGGQEFVWIHPDTTPDMYNGVYLEASSGFNLYHILRKGENPEGYDPIASKEQLKSPFVFTNDDGAYSVDMARYKQEVLEGKNVDIVILNIGDNDAFNLDLDNSDVALAAIKNDASTLIDHIQTLSENVIIGYMMPLNYSHNEHYWLLDYKGNYDRWTQNRRRHLFIKTINELQKERQDFDIIPSDFALDASNDYSNWSALHPPTNSTSEYSEQMLAWAMNRLCTD